MAEVTDTRSAPAPPSIVCLFAVAVSSTVSFPLPSLTVELATLPTVNFSKFPVNALASMFASFVCALKSAVKFLASPSMTAFTSLSFAPL